MITICLTIYLLIGLVFIGSLALMDSRPAPQQANFHPTQDEIHSDFTHTKSPLRHAA